MLHRFISNAREAATLRALLFLLYVFSEDDNLSLGKDWSPPFAVIARSKTGNREGRLFSRGNRYRLLNETLTKRDSNSRPRTRMQMKNLIPRAKIAI